MILNRQALLDAAPIEGHLPKFSPAKERNLSPAVCQRTFRFYGYMLQKGT